jgi:anti-anti-sigma factor
MSLTERRSARRFSKETKSAGTSLPALFAVECSTNEGETVLTLHGALDIWTQQAFVTALDAVDDNAERVVLDLTDLSFMDARSIGIIHRARTLAEQRGHELLLRSPSRRLSRVLKLTGLAASR